MWPEMEIYLVFFFCNVKNLGNVGGGNPVDLARFNALIIFLLGESRQI